MKKSSLFVSAMLMLMLAFTVSAQDYFPEPDLSNPAAPFIFTYHYAIDHGATAEWRKQEGVIIDDVNRKLYMAVSRLTSAMSDGEGDIQLADNPCGAVYVGDLDADWNVSELRPLIIGGPYDSESETCSFDNISEPDNLFVDANGDLWIYENTEERPINMAWKYIMSTGELLRFATLPAGSEGTGLRIHDGNLFLNVQHPDSDNIEPFNRGTIGVVTGFTATDPFTPVPVPEGDATRTLIIAAGEYQVLGRSGDMIPGSEQEFGSRMTTAGDVMDDRCNNPDGNMYIPTTEDGTAGILYTNWECTPGAVSRIELAQNAEGTWSINEGYHVDFGAVNGVINNCNASVTPWGTGLTSEEHAPLDATTWLEDYAARLNRMVDGIANPYDYGYISELIPNEDGSTSVVKHYVMGRRENEQAWVAPDQQTVYFGDDGRDKIFYKFVATTPGDLSAGTLYAAHVVQTGTNDTTDHAFTIEWIELGTSDNATVEAAVRALDAGK